eukprot:TRINITY_DN1940_c0_g1_i1.p1 TRINITY_DN1940_c0_g1~~TRINITY_DN1940_c0_g1_i1.p1  ORF type:complete len:455 (-),score=99.71 TRINITY_DN1940_c0_g1_i1:20-1384(-)
MLAQPASAPPPAPHPTPTAPQLPPSDQRIDVISIKAQLQTSLGERSSLYFTALREFWRAKLSKLEFDHKILNILGESGVATHNRLIRGILLNASCPTRPAVPIPPAVPKPAPAPARRVFSPPPAPAPLAPPPEHAAPVPPPATGAPAAPAAPGSPQPLKRRRKNTIKLSGAQVLALASPALRLRLQPLARQRVRPSRIFLALKLAYARAAAAQNAAAASAPLTPTMASVAPSGKRGKQGKAKKDALPPKRAKPTAVKPSAEAATRMSHELPDVGHLRLLMSRIASEHTLSVSDDAAVFLMRALEWRLKGVLSTCLQMTQPALSSSNSTTTVGAGTPMPMLDVGGESMPSTSASSTAVVVAPSSMQPHPVTPLPPLPSPSLNLLSAAHTMPGTAAAAFVSAAAASQTVPVARDLFVTGLHDPKRVSVRALMAATALSPHVLGEELQCAQQRIFMQ